ncbi:TyrS-associated PheT N-terminal domain-related protein TapR [Mycoplasmopsis synoviae]|uniref:TyrS-associated PheT N-terminal domain-related protein TapR n=1 Tax=Mycoplasmopsis synoviae TaxID=2109 RepID=UPI000CA1527B|nr:hypothetical protein [Mycoplasmopsis synoviae]AKJ20844.1 Phenylalanyl-tRNA synthetase domain protein (BsuYtpR) [Mycoplasmopsis synoviae]AQU48169.1 Phenylalanyl-tRNA synthetase domain protein (BsuYtpR) [Mycoplasmopsis synoviae]AWL84385.1 hypothetical protein MSH_03225 [Mycoplasmopsis synoviae]QLE14102.1 hypothetical protein DEH79_03220 [Mycoplasmopsis synoviae]UZF64249.1 hypothetical protein N0B76_03255 [Mycoplasmopsis synoviae]
MFVIKKFKSNFENIAIAFINMNVNVTKQLKFENFIVFCDDNYNINSVNILDLSKLKLEKNELFFSADSKLKTAIEKELKKLDKNLKLGENLVEFFTFAKVLEVEKHPKSDSLFVLKLDAKRDKEVQIVTNSTLVKKDMIILIANPGSVTAKGDVILKSSVMGIESQGMIMSYKNAAVDKDGVFTTKDEKLIGTEYLINA